MIVKIKHIFLFLIITTALFLFNQASAKLEKKTRVILIGIDGLFQYCMNKANISAIKRIQSEGSYTYKARTSIWAYSGPGWSHILCGIGSDDSGIINNAWQPAYLTRNHSSILPITGYEPLPCIYKELKTNNNKLITKASTAWSFLLYFGNTYVDGNYLDEEKYCYPYDTKELTNNCDIKTRNETIKFIQDDFDFIFSYFGSVDEFGHLTGFCSEDYINQISRVNQYIEDILSELKKQGIYDDTYIIITTDHGAEKNTTNHGVQDDDNIIIPWMIKGPGIKKNYEIKNYVRNLITPKVVLKLFGYKGNKYWRGKIPEDMFEESSDFIDNKAFDIADKNNTNLDDNTEVITNHEIENNKFLNVNKDHVHAHTRNKLNEGIKFIE